MHPDDVSNIYKIAWATLEKKYVKVVIKYLIITCEKTEGIMAFSGKPWKRKPRGSMKLLQTLKSND